MTSVPSRGGISPAERLAHMNVYQIITDRIIEELEQGQIPWQKPWTGTDCGAFNRVSKKTYSFLNQMLLKNEGEYATYKQWKEIGGQVRKGENAETVVFWKMVRIEEQGEEGEVLHKTIPVLKYYSVFHISQVDGVEPLEQPELNDIEPVEEAENLFMGYITRDGIRLEQTMSGRAFYRPSEDMIHLPVMGQFNSVEEYYSTAFHEATHSTMKETRCNRPQKTAAFGNAEYSKEELVAEIGSAALVNITGLETAKSFRNNAAYIQSWLKVLKNDNRFIVSASSKAEKAINYILGRGEEE